MQIFITFVYIFWTLSAYKNPIKHVFFYQIDFLCIQHAKSSIKTILSKIFEQNVDFVKVDQFSTPSFKYDDVSRKL